ncbi:MAG: GGDEF domain-containing protein [Rectinemataceae bacterium]|nr:GGDEF domain-containing protein [Rectinemataceae bacterium]
MEKTERFYGVIAITLLTIVVLPIIWAFQGFLLFHVLVENICIMVHILLFVVGTRTYKFSKNSVVLFISTAYLYVAALGFLHALSYKGMNLIVGIETGMATQFWVARRLMEVMSLLLATFLGRKSISFVRLNLVYSLITLGLIVAIFTKVFPVCYIDGVGLTAFKKISEYLIILTGALTLLRLKTLRQNFDLVYVKVIGWAIAFGLAAELVFTLYVSVYDIFNGIGHLLYLFSSSLLVVFIVREGLDKPYNIMFHTVYEKSIRDALTGLYNRNGLEEFAHASFERAKRFKSTFCLLMMDLDNFKTVNDEYGHMEGDEALKEFKELLTRAFREYDIVARLGGDEFVVLLEDGAELAIAAQRRLEAAMETWKATNHRRLRLGISFGMAVRDADSTASLAELLAEADAKLIQEKSKKHS